ncbi:BatA domain-containing protein [Isosphaeraceae bacterium EP7]
MLPPVVLALGFANLPLLYGLGAASLPILLHLLNRRKFREVPWAAMRFLVAAMRKNQRRVRVEHWLLLAVRTMLVIAVVLAMAKPFLESMGALPVLAGQRTHRVLVLDGSLSMGYAPAEATRFDQAKQLAIQVVREARRGDVTSVVLMADPPKVIIGTPSPSADEVRKELESMVMPHGGTDLVASFAAIDRVLDVSTIPQKEVVFLTDLQATSWRKPEAAAELKRVVDKVQARKARSVVIDLGKEGSGNHAVTELALGAPVVTSGSTVSIRTVVRNFGPAPTTGASVRLVVDGQVGPEQTVDLPVGEDVPLVFTQTFNSDGDHVVEARVDEDSLKLDDRRVLAVPVRESLKVLLVDGDFKSEAFQAETDYLAQALSPSGDQGGPASPIKVQVVPENQLVRRELSDYDAVILCNVAQVTEAEVASLEGYLKQGGGVVIFGGDQVLADNYNRLLYADGKGLLPALIGPSVGDAKLMQTPFTFDAKGFKHPIVALFGDESDQVQAGLTSVKTWKYQALKLPADTRARVALAFSGTGDPAVIEAPRYRGTVVQVATTADAGWTTWPVHPSFPPVMEQVVFQAAAGRLAERNVRVGQPLDQALPPAGAEVVASVRTPDGRDLPARLKPDGDVSLLHFEETDLSGLYKVKIGPPLARESTFAAVPDPAESDPAKLDRAGLAAAVPGWNFAYFVNLQQAGADTAAISRQGELHRPLLFAVLALLLIESTLAWKFGHHA